MCFSFHSSSASADSENRHFYIHLYNYQMSQEDPVGVASHWLSFVGRAERGFPTFGSEARRRVVYSRRPPCRAGPRAQPGTLAEHPSETDRTRSGLLDKARGVVAAPSP